jgi:hypothetical protein
MSHRRAVMPGRYHIAMDYKADTNRFVVDVTDSSLALSTIRSTFVTADERIRWRVPSGSFIFWCARPERELGSACVDLQAWAASQAGVQRIAFDPSGVSPLRDGAVAYRYADDQALGRIRACVRTINPAILERSYLALQIRTRVGPWMVDHVLDPSTAPRVTSDPSCGLPRSIVDYGKTFSSYPLSCPTPTASTRQTVVERYLRLPDTRQWFSEHGVTVPSADSLDPLSGPDDVARCRHIDSTSAWHPTMVFRAGPYFIAANVDATSVERSRPDVARLEGPRHGPRRGFRAWVLDSANNVVHTPEYSAPSLAPRDVHVTSMRGGAVVLQWTRPTISPNRYELQRASGTGTFASIGAAIPDTAQTAVDTSARRGTAYRYRLLAWYSSSDIFYSNVVSSPIVGGAQQVCLSAPSMAQAAVQAFLRDPSTAVWRQALGITAVRVEDLRPLTDTADAALCRRMDSALVRHPVFYYWAGRHVIATNFSDDAVPAFVSEGEALTFVFDKTGVLVEPPASPRHPPPRPR